MPAADARTRTAHRPLAATLVAGAVYDLIFAVLMVAAPAVIARTFGLPLPGERFYLWLLALLLLMLSACYLAAARDPVALRAIVAVAIGGRGAGFLVLAGCALGRPDLAGLWPVAVGDLLFALAHLATGRRLWA